MLILQLLEKDPGKLPGISLRVLRALESIESARGKRGRGRNIGRSRESALRRVFVGREAELRQLQSAFDAAVSGRGR